MRLPPAVICLAAIGLAACQPSPPAMRRYDYPELGFSISFPAPPKVTDQPATAAGAPHTVLVEADAGGRDFAISIAEGTNPGTDIDQVTTEAAVEMTRAAGGEASVRTYAATAEGVMGRELTFTRSGRPVAKARLYLEGGRFYVLAAKSLLGTDDPAVDDFLTSFRLIARRA